MSQSPQINVRKAQLDDVLGIREICRNIWGTDDYVVRAVPRWIRSNRNCLPIVSIADDSMVVGIANIRVSGSQGWLEGARVHPEFQNIGISHRMMIFLFESPLGIGRRFFRLTTGLDNFPVHAILNDFGFKCSFTMTYLRIQISSDSVSKVQIKPIFPTMNHFGPVLSSLTFGHCIPAATYVYPGEDKPLKQFLSTNRF